MPMERLIKEMVEVDLEAALPISIQRCRILEPISIFTVSM